MSHCYRKRSPDRLRYTRATVFCGVGDRQYLIHIWRVVRVRVRSANVHTQQPLDTVAEKTHVQFGIPPDRIGGIVINT